MTGNDKEGAGSSVATVRRRMIDILLVSCVFTKLALVRNRGPEQTPDDLYVALSG
jgi:hypothetical protein